MTTNTCTTDDGMENDLQWMEPFESMPQQQQEAEDDQQYRIQHRNRNDTKPMRDLTHHPDKKFVHDDENDEEVDDVITSVSSSLPNENKKKTKKKRHGARNQHKMKYFVQWIHETFLNHNTDIAMSTQKQQDQLESISSAVSPKVLESTQSHSHLPPPPPPHSSSYHYVLDVAGGKGELAARLVMCCPNIHVTLVDPRKADIINVYQNWIVPKLPKKWQQQYYSKLQMNENFINDILTERYVQLQMYFTTETIQNHSSKDSSNTDGITTLRKAIEQCTLMIGMHADSATECIVDMALQYQKPFVVVPCCVFPNLFPQRYVTIRSSDTTTTTIPNHNSITTTTTTTKIPVRTYEQFCDYLHQKDVRFQRTVLPFDGRNIAIWWDGK